MSLKHQWQNIIRNSEKLIWVSQYNYMGGGEDGHAMVSIAEEVVDRLLDSP